MTAEKVKKRVVVEILFQLMAFPLGELFCACSSPTLVFKTKKCQIALSLGFNGNAKTCSWGRMEGKTLRAPQQ